MNELKPNAKIISEFKGEINGHVVNSKHVYYTVINILDIISEIDITFTKPHDFIADLITAFTALEQYHKNNRYSYLELKILDILDETTTLDELTNNLTDFMGNEHCPQLYTICDGLKNSYYTS